MLQLLRTKAKGTRCCRCILDHLSVEFQRVQFAVTLACFSAGRLQASVMLVVDVQCLQQEASKFRNP